MKPSFKTTIITAAVAGATAAFLNSILYFCFDASGMFPDDVYIQENQPMSVLPVVLSSIVPALFAGVVFYLLCRYTRNGYKIFFHVSIILLILSFANPFMAIKDIPIEMGIALNIMHIIVVSALLYFFKRINAGETKMALR